MHFFRWLSLASLLTLAACSAKGGGGFAPPPADDVGTGDSSVPPDGTTNDSTTPPDGTVPPVDGTVLPDAPSPVDGTVTPDVPPPIDGTVGPDTPPPPDLPVGPLCGDRTCNGEELCSTCPQDCGTCPPPPDVPVELFCGDRMCSLSRGETCMSCPADCGTCPPPPDVPIPDVPFPDVPIPDPCAAVGSTCSACAGLASAGCGWCSNVNRCVMGSSSGPSPSVTGCSTTSGTWVRSTSSCGTTSNPTATCTSSTWSGITRECNWRLGGTLSCTPGRSYTVGCNSTTGTTGTLCAPTIGSCSGDPVLRVCPGASPCSAMQAIAADDDTCGTCPVVTAICPSSGQITVLTGSYDATRSGTCTPSLR